MSRSISGRPSASPQDIALKDTQAGKLAVTRYNGNYLALLLRGSRLLAASVFSDSPSKVGSVYIGKVKNLVKNINACFVEIADGELCFLPLADCRTPFMINRRFDGRILEGDELVVQVVRDALKTKQAAVTTKISLSGKYIAVSAGSPKTGISSKLSPLQKEALFAMLKRHGLVDSKGYLVRGGKEEIPFGIVVRTEAGRLVKESASVQGLSPADLPSITEEEDFLAQFEALLEQFTQLFQNALHRTCFSCLQGAAEPYQTAIEQFYPEEYDEVVTDVDSLYPALKEYYGRQSGPCQKPVRFYQDSSYSLSKLYSIESRLQDALSARVWLKSGGYLVIEPTEALTVIDVNTGKYSVQKDMMDTFYQINREAAREIALQLRLRNLSGIIVVDFINMDSSQKQEELLQYMKQLVRSDRVRTSVIDMTPLGLVEITRKKINRSLKEQLEQA